MCSGGGGQSLYMRMGVCLCVLAGCQLDMEIRQNKQQFKHEHYIRGRRLAVPVGLHPADKGHKALCAPKQAHVCFFVSVTQQTQQTQHLPS